MGWKSDVTAANMSEAFPAYLADFHGRLLLGATDITGNTLEAADEWPASGTYEHNVLRYIEEAIEANPYAAAEAYDPESDLDTAQQGLEDVKTSIDALTTTAAFEDYIEFAKEMFDEHDVDVAGEIADLVEAYETETESEYFRRLSQFLGGMYQINAIDSSPFIMGLAVLASDRANELAAYRSRLLIQSKERRSQFLLNAVATLFNIEGRNLDYARHMALTLADFHRMKVVAMREKYQQDIEYDVADVQWPLEQLKTGASFIGAMQGVPTMERKPSTLATALTNAFSVGPQVGMAVGQATRNPAAGLGAGLLAAFVGGAAAFATE